MFLVFADFNDGRHLFCLYCSSSCLSCLCSDQGHQAPWQQFQLSRYKGSLRKQLSWDMKWTNYSSDIFNWEQRYWWRHHRARSWSSWSSSAGTNTEPGILSAISRLQTLFVYPDLPQAVSAPQTGCGRRKRQADGEERSMLVILCTIVLYF